MQKKRKYRLSKNGLLKRDMQLEKRKIFNSPTIILLKNTPTKCISNHQKTVKFHKTTRNHLAIQLTILGENQLRGVKDTQDTYGLPIVYVEGVPSDTWKALKAHRDPSKHLQGVRAQDCHGRALRGINSIFSGGMYLNKNLDCEEVGKIALVGTVRYTPPLPKPRRFALARRLLRLINSDRVTIPDLSPRRQVHQYAQYTNYMQRYALI